MDVLENAPNTKSLIETFAPDLFEISHIDMHHPIVQILNRIDYNASFASIRNNLGTLLLAIFFFFWELILVILFPIMYVGYLFVIFFYWIAPNSTTTGFFAPWFFHIELNLAVWKSIFGLS